MRPRRGQRFEHARRLDTTWKPGPGQKYADAPREVYEISNTGGGLVWYRPIGSRVSWVADECEMQIGNGIVGRWIEAD